MKDKDSDGFYLYIPAGIYYMPTLFCKNKFSQKMS